MKKAAVRFDLSMSEPLQDCHVSLHSRETWEPLPDDDSEAWPDIDYSSEADEEADEIVPQLLMDPHLASINDQYKEMLAREAQEELDRQVASALLEEDQHYLLKNKQVAPLSKPITESGISADLLKRAKARAAHLLEEEVKTRKRCDEQFSKTICSIKKDEALLRLQKKLKAVQRNLNAVGDQVVGALKITEYLLNNAK